MRAPLIQGSLNLRAGESVEVRSKGEILATLDQQGCLDRLPFMPQMLQYCGRRLRVFKRAHKTCDTVHATGGRRMSNAVHLEGARCDGEVYGGCQAGCLIFWKEAWLKRPGCRAGSAGAGPAGEGTGTGHADDAAGCTEADVWAGTQRAGGQDRDGPTYVCQATLLPYATTPLPYWDVRQYLEDYRSGNVGAARMLRTFVYAGCYNLSQAGLGLGRMLIWFYDRLQALWGGIPFPRKWGSIPLGERTPSVRLELKPGELVRVRSYDEIRATLDWHNKNHGLTFDAEMVPYCGRTYRVLRRVNRIIDEKTGKLVSFKNESVILEGVVCQARYSNKRLFCPRSIFPYWREIWLERVAENNQPSVPR